MTSFSVGARVAEVPYYNWKKYMAGVPLDQIPDVRYGEIVSKRIKMGYPAYTVEFSDGRVVELDGVNFVSMEDK